MTRRRRLLLSLVFSGLAILAGPVVSAHAGYVHKAASLTFPVTGTPRGIALDEQSESVYVVTAEGSLEKFDSAGAPSNFSTLGSNSLSLACEYECRGLAVDNSGGPNQGVIYVGRNQEEGILVILPSGASAGPIENHSGSPYGSRCGVSVDKAGRVYGVKSYEKIVDRYVPAEWATHLHQEPQITGTLVPDFFNPCKGTVDSKGTLYLIQGTGEEAFNALHKVPGLFGEPNSLTSINDEIATTILEPHSTWASADLQTDDIYTDRRAAIARFSTSGELLETFGEGEVSESFGVAVDGTTKTVYVTSEAAEDVIVFPEVLTPDVSEVKAATVPGGVTFSAHVSPAGGGNVTACAFEFRPVGETTFTPAPCDQGLPFESATDVSADASGLSEGTVYEYRLTAENTNAAEHSGIRRFKIASPAIEGTYSTELSETGGVLNARIDTNHAASEYFFEYGTTREYGQTSPIPVGQIEGGRESSVAVSTRLTNLEPHVIYHFRVVVQSALGTVASEDQTFNFFPEQCPNAVVRQQTGSGFLPDCRSYELVTPSQQGNIILNPFLSAPPAGYSTNPARFAFAGYAGGITGTEPVIGLGPDVYVATRTNTGWVTALPGIRGYETNWAGVMGTTANTSLGTFMDFSGLSRFKNNEIFETENIPYIWNSDGDFLGHWPVTASAIPRSSFTNGYVQPSPDFSHMALSSSNVQFAPNGLLRAPGSVYDYDTKNATTEIVSLMPNGHDIAQEPEIMEWPGEERVRKAFEQEEVISFPGIANPNGAGGPTDTKRPALVNPGVSTDGSHILMSVSSEPYDPRGFTEYDELPPVHLYMTVDDALHYDVSEGDRAQFVGMTADGSKVFFLSAEQLSPEDHDTSTDLYMWSEATRSLKLLSLGSEGSGNSDGCNSTWVSPAAYAPWTTQCDVQPIAISGKWSDTSMATQAEPDIYFLSPEQLDGSKGEAGGENIYHYKGGGVHYVASGEVTRMDVSPNGEHMAYVSPDQLTSYDNKGYEEMYTYEPATEKLRCVSCNPTGAPPVGNVEASGNGQLFMSNDGRTFFYTADGLVAKDTNKIPDVYEYTEGRPQLLTTGTGSHDVTLSYQGNVRDHAAFMGVSADGVNVYIDTYETLVPQDENGEFLKFYDVRSGGGFPIASPKQPCVAADECHGTASSSVAPTGIASEGELGSGGNTHPASKTPARRQRRRSRKRAGRHRHGKRHHLRARGTRLERSSARG